MKKKYIPKIGDTVRTIKSVSPTGTGENRIGIIKRINNVSEVWVDYPDGSGGLYKKVIPHKKVNWDLIELVLIRYKAGEITLPQSLTGIENFIYDSEI